MLTLIGNGVSSALTMGGNVFKAVLNSGGAWADVQEVIGLQIGMGVIGWAIVKMKSLVYGF